MKHSQKRIFMDKEPLFYEQYPGSIVDISQLQYM